MTASTLEGKVVALTGANGRLGQCMVDGLAEQGATLAAIVREAGSYALPAAATGRVFATDVTDEAAVAACFRQIADAFGRVDALVHTVGAWGSRPFLDTALADWDKLVALNLTSAFLCFREAARHMQGRGGRLIGFASGQGADRGRAQQGAYSAAKAGVVRLVEAVAGEFAGSGITAHAIAPSTILFDEGGEEQGVYATHLVDLACFLCGPAGEALHGATLRAYGTLR